MRKAEREKLFVVVVIVGFIALTYYNTSLRSLVIASQEIPSIQTDGTVTLTATGFQTGGDGELTLSVTIQNDWANSHTQLIEDLKDSSKYQSSASWSSSRGSIDGVTVSVTTTTATLFNMHLSQAQRYTVVYGCENPADCCLGCNPITSTIAKFTFKPISQTATETQETETQDTTTTTETTTETTDTTENTTTTTETTTDTTENTTTDTTTPDYSGTPTPLPGQTTTTGTSTTTSGTTQTIGSGEFVVTTDNSIIIVLLVFIGLIYLRTRKVI